MKQRLTAGAELELLTKDELQSVLRSWMAELTRGAKFLRRSIQGEVAANGSLLIEGGDLGFKPNPGFTWAVTRLTIDGLSAGQKVAVYANDANPSSLLVPELEALAAPAVTSSAPTLTTGTNPAAGAEVSVTVPAGEVWEVQSVQFALQTDATVANRRVNIRVDDGASIFATAVANVDQAASATVTYIAGVGGIDYTAVRDGKLSIGLPTPLLLGPGWRIRTTTTNLQAGDDYAAPVIGYVRTTTTTAASTDETPSLIIPGDHGIVLQESDELVVAGSGLTPAAKITVTGQIKEVPSQMAWSL